jgi:hypothetical protein
VYQVLLLMMTASRLAAVALYVSPVQGWISGKIRPSRVSLMQRAPFSSQSLISDSCWRSEGLAAIDEYSSDLLEIVDELRQQPFFRYYSVNLLNGCNYFPQQEDECDSRYN